MANPTSSGSLAAFGEASRLTELRGRFLFLVGALVGCLAGSADAPEEFVPVTRPARVEVSALLRATALPELRLLQEAVADVDGVVILTDAEGVVLERFGEGEFAGRAERVALRPGVAWSEATTGTNAIGNVKQGYIETSNVNVVEELVQMITTQRAFQASARMITTSDSILEELVNLKR